VSATLYSFSPLLCCKFLRILPFLMPDMSAIANPQQRQFNPYTENGGTILAVAGADFTVIAGDTRQSEGYSIQTRYAPKVFRLFVQFFS
jgi:20S proteasome alpha/beta subunit